MKQLSSVLANLLLLMVAAAPLAAALEKPSLTGDKASGNSINRGGLTRRALLAGPNAAGCVCPAVFKPVCGADGRVYSNDCRARCSWVNVTGPLPSTASPGSNCGTNQPAASPTVGEGPSPNATRDLCLHSCGPEPQVVVCGADGKSYGTGCQAKCAGVHVVGPLQPGDICSTNMPASPPVMAKPVPNASCLQQCGTGLPVNVCGDDGWEYGTDCQAVCAGAKKTSMEFTRNPDGTCSVNQWQPAASPPPSPAPNATRDNCLRSCGPEPQVVVCGADGKSYGTGCQAKCAGVRVVGHLQPGDICSTKKPASPPVAAKPVPKQSCLEQCGTTLPVNVCGDGFEYGTDCQAFCAGAKKISMEFIRNPDGTCNFKQ